VKSVELHHGDGVAGMKSLPPSSVDVIVTSPPYNIGTKYRSYSDDMEQLHYLAWTFDWLVEASRVLKPKGSLFLNIGAKPSDPMMPYYVCEETQKAAWSLQNVIHWIKSIALDAGDIGAVHELPDGLSVGHYKPINSPRFLNDCHEFIFHLTHDGDVPLDRLALGVPYADKTNAKRWGGGDLRCRGNTWFMPYPTIQRSRSHPAVFPVTLPERCLKLHGLERVEVVLDPFMGIGTTAVACVRLGLEFIGFDLDAEYVEDARSWVAEEQKALDKRDESG